MIRREKLLRHKFSTLLEGCFGDCMARNRSRAE